MANSDFQMMAGILPPFRYCRWISTGDITGQRNYHLGPPIKGNPENYLMSRNICRKINLSGGIKEEIFLNNLGAKIWKCIMRICIVND